MEACSPVGREVEEAGARSIRFLSLNGGRQGRLMRPAVKHGSAGRRTGKETSTRRGSMVAENELTKDKLVVWHVNDVKIQHI